MSADRRMFFSPEAGGLLRAAVRSAVSVSRDLVGAHPAMGADALYRQSRICRRAGVSRCRWRLYLWIIPLAEDDEALELAHWRAMSPPDSVAFRKMLEDAVTAPH